MSSAGAPTATGRRSLPTRRPHDRLLKDYCLLPVTSLYKLSVERPDLMVVVAYGLLLPRKWLEWPRLGCINMHPGLLPRHQIRRLPQEMRHSWRRLPFSLVELSICRT